MPAPILHVGAVVTCAHGGTAFPAMASTSVFVSGNAIVTLASPYVVSGCPFTPPAGNGPCVTAQWIAGSRAVMSHGMPVVTLASESVCQPTGTPLEPVSAQLLVQAT
jgi:hypothetical protein